MRPLPVCVVVALSAASAVTGLSTGGVPPRRQVIFVRHGESEYNAQGRFIGWADPDLTPRGVEEAQRAAAALAAAGYAGVIDEVHASYLKRSIKSAWIITDTMGASHVPVHCDWRLNEQMYGALQGLSKRAVAREHGLELTQKWRRSYDVAPPPVPGATGYFPPDRRYAQLTDDDAPESWCGSARTESLKDTQARVWRLWRERIRPAVRAGRTPLVVGHGNVVRALLKRLDSIEKERLREISIPRAMPLVYELDEDLRPVRSPQAFGVLSGHFLATPAEIAAALRVESTEAQLGVTADGAYVDSGGGAGEEGGGVNGVNGSANGEAPAAL